MCGINKKNIRTTIVIPVYNEIRFIERTLQSVVGEADQILIGDNASDDGTSEICRDFARKHPEIEYYRHEKNLGANNNCFFLFEKIKGKYYMDIGAHDILARGTIKKMADFMDSNPQVSKTIFKNVINVDGDYNFEYVYHPDEYDGKLESEDVFERVKAVISTYGNGASYYGLNRVDTYKKISRQFCLLPSDHTLYALYAKEGKVVTTDSTFYRINPHKKNESCLEHYTRIINAICEKPNMNPHLFIFSVLLDSYIIAEDMAKLSNAPKNYKEDVENIAINRFGYCLVPKRLIKLSDIPDEKREFAKSIIKAVINRYNEGPKRKVIKILGIKISYKSKR